MRKFIAGVMLLLVLTVGLFLDLRAHGLVWQVFWSLTGEETPLAQIRGMIEYTGNLIRPQPKIDALVPVNHANMNPYGINTFLQLESEVVKVEQQLKQISAAGFAWIRQEFAWEDIEIHARGDFEDRRNIAHDGGVDAWAKYDRIVALTEQYGIQIQARISNPPEWAQRPDSGDMAPPIDDQDYANFAAQVAERYRGRIRYYQLWNEPNIYPEWGENDVDPEAYTELLCAAHDAIKAVDPEAVIISGAMASTIEMGGRNLSDFIFLERMYLAGAGDCFDILSMQGYGLNSGPTDQRMRPVTVNVGRNQYIRELMVSHGDAHKPIWLSEAAWNAVPSEEEHPEHIDARMNFGQVTVEQQARYMPLFYERIRNEWPYIGMVNYWFFTLPSDSRSNESFYYFRIAEPDYSDDKPVYTTRPIYDTMKAHITADDHALHYGVHQLDGHWLVTTDGAPQSAESAQFETALAAQNAQFLARGTSLSLRWQGGDLTVSINGQTQTLSAPTGVWLDSSLASSLTPETWNVTLSSGTPVLLDSVTVDQKNTPIALAAAGGAALLIASTAFIILKLRQRKAA